MPKNPQIYTDALANFTNTYKMEDYDLGKTIETDRKFRFLNDTDGSTPAQQYSRLAADTMASYFVSATKLRENGTPTLHGFNYSRFIDDFEKLVDAKFRSELDDAESGRTREEFNGADKKKVIKDCQKRARQSFNKTLPTLWKDNIKSGNTKINDMKKITDSLFAKLSDKDADKSKLTGELINIVAAYEAMKQVRESRNGFFGAIWKLFNKEQNLQEKEYCESLGRLVEDLEFNHYNVQGITNALNAKTVLGKAVKNPVKDDNLYKADSEEPENQNFKDAEKPERTHKAFFKVNEGVVEEIGIDEMLAQRLNEDLNKNITSQKSEIHTESKEINPPDLKIN